MRSFLAGAVALAAAFGPIFCCFAASPYDPPAGYYNSATGTGAALKSQLHDIIDGHTIQTYGEARSYLQVTDADPDNPGHILLVYDRVSLDVSGLGGSIPGWDSGVSWNREHTWPKALGVGDCSNNDSNRPSCSDLHQLRPATNPVNTSRSNLDFGGAFGQPFGRVSDGGTKWYPGDADAGMIARQEFYMAVRYDGSDANTVDLELAETGSSAGRLGRLSRMIEWHFAAPPDEFERRRNDVIYDNYQGNRNPFVDHPEWVWSVFVDQQNDSQLSLSGAGVSADGGSMLSVDLGRHYVGQPAALDVAATVQKLGDDGAYFRVTGDGVASSVDSLYAARTGGPDSVSLVLNEALDTSVAGPLAGALTIDNLDVTTGFGLGHGAQDADDLIQLSGDVLNHPVASLSAEQSVTNVTIDLGEVPLGFSGDLATGFAVHNYAGAGAPAFAALLDLDVVGSGSGDTDALGLGLAPFSGLEQGGSVGFDVSLDAAASGDLSATFDLGLSGEDLPGEQTQGLIVTLLATVSDFLAGDFNKDGQVDTSDYTVWRDSEGLTGLDPFAPGDATGDGVIDAADRAVWAANFGASSVVDAVATPEPGALACATLLGLASVVSGRRRR